MGPSDFGPSLGLSTLNTPSAIHFAKHVYAEAALHSLDSCNCCFGHQLAHSGLMIAFLNLVRPRLLILIIIMI